MIADGDVIMSEVLNVVASKETQSQVAIAVGAIHPDIEKAAMVARACYDAGLAMLRPGHTFGDVADAMVQTVRDAGGWNIHPMVHSINPLRPGMRIRLGIKGFPACPGLRGAGYRSDNRCGTAAGTRHDLRIRTKLRDQRTHGQPGGTVIVGDDDPIELNSLTAQLLRR